ncbi:MAG: GNAT family N-acetyltransferase [Clostridiales bacterium]|nr:GNAT family N-acetyltransferase [Clostridiales bacterium]
MIYYSVGSITVRDLEPSDPQKIFDGQTEQGWHPDIKVYEKRLADAASGDITALAADLDGCYAGHVNIFWHPKDGPFRDDGIPMIVDFAVLEKYQRRGVGRALMDTAENIAANRADAVCLAVGMHSGYGAAQRLYIKRGYIPDGSGIWYDGRQWPQYEGGIVNDDELMIWLKKEFRR